MGKMKNFIQKLSVVAMSLAMILTLTSTAHITARADGNVAEVYSADQQTLIGTYTDLASAISVANTTAQYAGVKLLQDVDISSTLSLSNDINLFLNNHTITFADGAVVSGNYSMDVWGGTSSTIGGNFVVNGGTINGILLLYGDKENFNFTVNGGTVSRVQIFDGNLTVNGGTIENLAVDDGIVNIKGGTVSDLDVLNNMGSPTVTISGNPTIPQCLFEFYDNGGTETVTISGAPRIGLGFVFDGSNAGNWGSLTINGGYFKSDPAALYATRSEGYTAHMTADIGTVEAYSGQSDWAADSSTYGYRIVGTTDVGGNNEPENGDTTSNDTPSNDTPSNDLSTNDNPSESSIPDNMTDNGNGTFTVVDVDLGETIINATVVSEGMVYRMYNPNTGEHFYTKDANERDTLEAVGWNYEADASFPTISASEDGAVPTYRVYNPNSGLHHYTMDKNEALVLKSLGWNYEGISLYVYDKDSDKGTAEYRLYNPYDGQHHWTVSAGERDALTAIGWNDEGIAWRVK